MSNQDWYAAYWRDQVAPKPLDGHAYIKGCSVKCAEVVTAQRHISKLDNPTKEQVEMVARLRSGNA